MKSLKVDRTHLVLASSMLDSTTKKLVQYVCYLMRPKEDSASGRFSNKRKSFCVSSSPPKSFHLKERKNFFSEKNWKKVLFFSSDAEKASKSSSLKN